MSDDIKVGLSLAVALAIMGGFWIALWREAQKPRCWRCSGPTDHPGAPCERCREDLASERRARAQARRRCING